MNETLKERKRIKKIVEEQIDYSIKNRREKVHKLKYHTLSFSKIEKLKKNILFWIKNPNYVRRKKNPSLSNQTKPSERTGDK